MPIHVETRLVDFHISRAALDEAFAAMADEEGLDRRRTRGCSPTGPRRPARIVRNPDRIRKRVRRTSSTTTSAKVAPLGLKAQVVAYDRELCVAYYDEITRLLAERG